MKESRCDHEIKNRCSLRESRCDYVAAGAGHLNILKWLHEIGYKFTFNMCKNAAEFGQLEVLKWAKEQKYPFHELVCSAAAKSGH